MRLYILAKAGSMCLTVLGFTGSTKVSCFSATFFAASTMQPMPMWCRTSTSPPWHVFPQHPPPLVHFPPVEVVHHQLHVVPCPPPLHPSLATVDLPLHHVQALAKVRHHHESLADRSTRPENICIHWSPGHLPEKACRRGQHWAYNFQHAEFVDEVCF